MPPRRLRDRVLARVGMPTAGTVARESGGNWEHAALEVRRVRVLTSRVPLRGATGGEVGRGSPRRRGGKEGTVKELLPHRRRKDSFSLPQAPGAPSLHQIITDDVNQVPGEWEDAYIQRRLII
ncbi:hypothetical protein NDU88_010379 [Pleurodeles waltl]|uniref:Uncharacterized protein n=1 Tax=Pleurodeles waltl TaxID=8319 RepID=A0AAV7QXB3_PLEWA|nr:hypothetical protein NDU88_010379 [Pleurodeles waltl]